MIFKLPVSIQKEFDAISSAMRTNKAERTTRSSGKYQIHCIYCKQQAVADEITSYIECFYSARLTKTHVAVKFDVDKKVTDRIEALGHNYFVGSEVTVFKCSECSKVIKLLGNVRHQTRTGVFT